MFRSPEKELHSQPNPFVIQPQPSPSCPLELFSPIRSMSTTFPSCPSSGGFLPSPGSLALPPTGSSTLSSLILWLRLRRRHNSSMSAARRAIPPSVAVTPIPGFAPVERPADKVDVAAYRFGVSEGCQAIRKAGARLLATRYPSGYVVWVRFTMISAPSGVWQHCMNVQSKNAPIELRGMGYPTVSHTYHAASAA